MMSKNKNGSDSWGLCIEGLWRGWYFAMTDEEIANYIQMWHIYYHSIVMRVFCLPLKIFSWFCHSRCQRV